MLVYYPDVAFVLNFSMDYLSLAGTLRLMGLPLRHRRVAAAALLGGLYGAVAAVPGWEVLRLLSLPVAAGMVTIVCGRGRPRCTLLFLLVTAVLSGAVTMVQGIWQRGTSPAVILLLAGGLCYGALWLLFGGTGDKAVKGQLLRITLSHGGIRETITVLRDSGNLLKEPMTGKPVCIVERRAVERILAQTSPPLMPLSFQALGQENGILNVFFCDKITIGDQIYPGYPIGVTEQTFGEGGGFVGIWGWEDTLCGKDSSLG